MLRVRSGLFLLLSLVCASGFAQSLPAGYVRTDVFSGRTQPTVVRFAHDGRVFIAEKSGKVFVYDNLLSTSATLVVDLSGEVHNYWDRGLLGFALHPRFPEVPYFYVLYSVDGGAFSAPTPLWNDACAAPTTDGMGCVISGRLSRLTASSDPAAVAASEQILIEDWYQQFPSHSIGTLQFGTDGYLYASGGDGASFNHADYGQVGNPTYPDYRSPHNEGGALRAQGLEDEAGYANNASNPDPNQRHVWLNGAVIRVDATSGAPAPGNPLAGVSGESLNAQRIVAYGLRNPYRFTARPGTNELWVGNVGYNTWEAIDVVPDVTDPAPALTNFGWPCYEGPNHTQGYSSGNTSTLPICNTMYAAGADNGGRTPVTRPWLAYNHTTSSAVSGLAFYAGTSYVGYERALFFSDYNRSAIYVARDGDADGLPDPITLNANNDIPAANLFYGGSNVHSVYLTTGPGGDLFYLNYDGGKVARITASANAAPSAAIAIASDSAAIGAARTVNFTAANSVDPNAGDTLTYDWDLDGDGNFGDASGVTASHAYAAEGNTKVSVRVTDNNGASDTQSLIVTVLPAADLGVTVSDGNVSVKPAQALSYTMVVTNHGATAVVGASVAATFPAPLANVTWTCTAPAGSSCAASGAGDIADTIDLAAGASATYVIHATVDGGASDGATIAVAAAVAAPSGYGDPNAADNAADDTDTVHADLIFADGFDSVGG